MQQASNEKNEEFQNILKIIYTLDVSYSLQYPGNTVTFTPSSVLSDVQFPPTGQTLQLILS